MATDVVARSNRVAPGEPCGSAGELIVRIYSDAAGAAKLMAELATRAELNAALLEREGHWRVELRVPRSSASLTYAVEAVSRCLETCGVSFATVEIDDHLSEPVTRLLSDAA